MKSKNINLHILKASGELLPYIKEIEKVFNDSLDKISAKIAVSNIDIVVCDDKRQAIPELGVGGYTPTSNLIFIYLDSEFTNFLEETIKNNLERTLTHELSHTVRWSTVGYGKTLLEALISEGLADNFDIEINKKNPEPWDLALDSSQLRVFSIKAKEEYNNNKYNHSEWFYGSESKKIPRWTGYALGYNLVLEYLKNNPNKKSSQLHSLKAEEFIK